MVHQEILWGFNHLYFVHIVVSDRCLPEHSYYMIGEQLINLLVADALIRAICFKDVLGTRPLLLIILLFIPFFAWPWLRILSRIKIHGFFLVWWSLEFQRHSLDFFDRQSFDSLSIVWSFSRFALNFILIFNIHFSIELKTDSIPLENPVLFIRVLSLCLLFLLFALRFSCQFIILCL